VVGVFDPLQQVFGLMAPQLFASRELVLSHGDLERFPTFMREGPMASIESLCRSYGVPPLGGYDAGGASGESFGGGGGDGTVGIVGAPIGGDDGI